MKRISLGTWIFLLIAKWVTLFSLIPFLILALLLRWT